MSDVLQRPYWNGSPVKAGDLFTLTKRKGRERHTAVCELWSAQLGWEIKLFIDHEFQQSQICRSGEEWLETKEAWHSAMLEKGWT
jgi:hypothetical protein